MSKYFGEDISGITEWLLFACEHETQYEPETSDMRPATGNSFLHMNLQTCKFRNNISAKQL